MRSGVLACLAVVLPLSPALAVEMPSIQSLTDSASGLAYRAGKGVNVMLDKAGLPNALKEGDGGKPEVLEAAAKAPPTNPQEPRATIFGEMAYGAGLGVARGADWAYGYAHAGTVAAAPYAGQAWDLTRLYGSKAVEVTAKGFVAASPYASQAWASTQDAGLRAWDATASGADALRPYAIQALATSQVLGLQAWNAANEGARQGVVYMPVALEWATDAAAAGATTLVATGGVTFACGVAVTPFAAMTAGTAYLVCAPVSALGAYAGMQALRGVYDHIGRKPSESAFFIESLAGGIAGGAMGQKALASYTRWSLQSKYQDFSDYSKQVRRLTERNLKAWGPEVGVKRASGYHVDHVISVKCAWTQGVPLVVAASTKNLQYLTARENLSLGAKGC